MREEGLTKLLWGVLEAILEEKGRGQKQVAERMGVDAVNFGQMVEELEGKGLIERKIDLEDRRARKLYVTERGASCAAACARLRLPLRNVCWLRLDPEERIALLDMLVRIIEANNS